MKLFLRALALAMILAAPGAVRADEADVKSVDSIMAALYSVISGPAGQQRDWARMRYLFAPEAKMGAVGPRPNDMFGARVMTVEDYISRNNDFFLKDGFFEAEASRKMDSFGQLVHVWSTYEARRKLDDAKPFARGINSVQMYFDGKRWWLTSVLWRAEDDKLKLPDAK